MLDINGIKSRPDFCTLLLESKYSPSNDFDTNVRSMDANMKREKLLYLEIVAGYQFKSSEI